MNNGSGCILDPYDGRDHGFYQLGLTGAAPQTPILLERFALTPEDQEMSNGCTFFAAGEAFDTSCRSLGIKVPERSSKMAGYGWGRHQHSHPEFPLVDTGSWLRAAIQGMVRHGVAGESSYPWDPWALDEFHFSDGVSVDILRINSRPPLKAVRSGFDRRGPRGYNRVRGYGQSVLDQLDLALSRGFAYAISTAVDEAVTDASKTDPFIPYDDIGFKYVGYHAMCIIGRMWKDGKRWYRIQQSYGPHYRDNGRAWIDERYVLNARDRWLVIP